MKWFHGSIPDAIIAAKARHGVFIVYISGQDDLSKQMNETWKDSGVSELCEAENCVAVKIKASSGECTFFSQIYPVVVIPSTFFIGTNGTPLEVTGGHMGAEEFKEKINSVIQIHKSSPAMAVEPGKPPPPASPTTSAAATAAAAEPIPSTAADDDIDTAAKKPKIDLEDKVQKAKELLDQKREEKLRKEKEEQKQKELERVKTGREVQNLRQFQKDREILETQQQLKKDREDDKKARERVKEQIARDRAERAARFNKEKTEREKAQEEVRRTKLAVQQQAAVEAEAKRSENARIQFRLPDGSSIAHTFASAETLQLAHNFASQQLGGNVTLSTVFPRRTFTSADMSSSFIDLQLAPSAVVMVVKGQKTEIRKAGPAGGATTGILELILAPIMFVLNILRSLLSSFSTPAAPAAPSSASSSSSSSSSTSSSPRPSGSQASGAGGNSGAYQRKNPGGGGRGSHTDGNVHRFKANDDDDDEMTTWNGNSTQQL